MNAKITTLDVNGLVVTVTYKSVKNWYLRVCPPDGQIKMTAPRWMSQKAIIEIIGLQSDWIIQHQQAISILPPAPIFNRRDRLQLQLQAEPLFSKWQAIIGVAINEWRIKKMTTRWGTCNIEAKRIWLNLTLVKKPIECLEYIIVHELVHLLERNHNRRFYAHMDRFLPNWREIKKILDA
ncbi:MAG: SprT family zinc-dependent metalloprotease [Gammaproteobacteria bacterium]